MSLQVAEHNMDLVARFVLGAIALPIGIYLRIVQVVPDIIFASMCILPVPAVLEQYSSN
jgi:hypothetical protein